MMDVEYKKDLHHNYMVIKECEEVQSEPYCLRMLYYQSIGGLLPIEKRMIDNNILFYYDITGKQSLNNAIERSAFTYEKVKIFFLNIVCILEKAYEYLLMEDDFVLLPEYIYLDVLKEAPFLCYLSGYRKSMKEQMNRLIEYIMNKVDYNDKEAVLLIYSLYAVSKEEGFTLSHMHEVLQKENHVLEVRKSSCINTVPEMVDTFSEGGATLSEGEEKKESEKLIQKDTGIPVMIEKLVDEEEKLYYPLKTYLYTGLCILGGIAFVAFVLLSKIIYNSYANQIDYSKLFALGLLVICVEGFLLKSIWNGKRCISKMVKKEEYIDPRKLIDKIKPHSTLNGSNTLSFKKIINDKYILDKTVSDKTISDKAISDKNISDNKFILNKNLENDNLLMNKKSDIERFHNTEEEFGENPTCLLNRRTSYPEIFLEPIINADYERISIHHFPFFVGKLKKNVDYCIENDAVSRYHAKISKEDGHYYLTDLNSTNGTYLSDELLNTYEKREIKSGDEIAFADIKYIFQIKE